MTITKRFVGRRPNTTVAITPVGRERVTAHWEQLERLRRLGDTTRAPGRFSRREAFEA